MSGGLVVVAALFWAGGLARAPATLRVRQRRPLCVALLAFAVALTVDIPAVYVRVDGVLGRPNVADLIEHVSGMIGVWALLLALSGLGERASAGSRRRARIAALAAAVGASAGLFLAARLPVEATSFTDRYGNLPVIAAYWSITVAYFGVALVDLAQMIVAHSARAGRRAMRVGLRLVGAGVVLGALYSALKIVELVADEEPGAGAVRRVADRLDPVVLVVGAVVIGVGLLFPVTDTAWRRAGAGVRDRVALVRLRRLWLDLTAAMPEVVLGERPSLWVDVCGREASLRLYRRVIEIRDVALAAGGGAVPALSPDRVAALSAGLAPVDPGPGSASADSGAGGQEAGDELRPLLVLARRWPHGGRRGPGVAA